MSHLQGYNIFIFKNMNKIMKNIQLFLTSYLNKNALKTASYI